MLQTENQITSRGRDRNQEASYFSKAVFNMKKFAVFKIVRDTMIQEFYFQPKYSSRIKEHGDDLKHTNTYRTQFLGIFL